MTRAPMPSKPWPTTRETDNKNNLRRKKRRYRAEFVEYCRTLSDTQLRGVFQKETEAKRRMYVNVVRAEAVRRGIEL